MLMKSLENVAIVFQEIENVIDRKGYVLNKVINITGDNESAEQLAPELLKSFELKEQANSDDSDDYLYLSEVNDPVLLDLAESPEVRSSRACLLKNVRNNLYLEKGEEIQDIDFTMSNETSELISLGTGGVKVKTNLAQFLLLDTSNSFTLYNETDFAAGLVISLGVAALKSMASALGNYVGTKILSELFGVQSMSMEDLRYRLVSDIEQKNIEQTLREQRGVIEANEFLVRTRVNELDTPEKKANYLEECIRKITESCGIISQHVDNAAASPEYMTGFSILLLLHQESAKIRGIDLYSLNSYKATLEVALSKVDHIVSVLYENRKKHVSKVKYVSGPCKVYSGTMMCDPGYYYYDDSKIGLRSFPTRDYDTKGENSAEHVAERARTNHINVTLYHELDWMRDIKNCWEKELVKCH